MKVAVFSARAYDRAALDAANAAAGGPCALHYYETRLGADTVALAQGALAVCAFVNDQLDAATVAALAAQGTRLVALRCAGFNQVDLAACAAHGLTVARVPAYSPKPSPNTRSR